MLKERRHHLLNAALIKDEEDKRRKVGRKILKALKDANVPDFE